MIGLPFLTSPWFYAGAVIVATLVFFDFFETLWHLNQTCQINPKKPLWIGRILASLWKTIGYGAIIAYTFWRVGLFGGLIYLLIVWFVMVITEWSSNRLIGRQIQAEKYALIQRLGFDPWQNRAP